MSKVPYLCRVINHKQINFNQMTKKSILSKLEKNGYKVTFTMTGNVIAAKGNQSYSANSLNDLKVKLFN